MVPCPPAMVAKPSPLSTENQRFVATPLLTHLVKGDGTAQSEQPQLETSGLNKRRRRLVNDGKVVHLVLSSSELFHNADILNQAPDGEDGNREGDGSGKEEREL